jgi:hypothetical protein
MEVTRVLIALRLGLEKQLQYFVPIDPRRILALSLLAPLAPQN